eukprot:SAG11_NODE_2073_length_3858_cov_21.209364_3_plen_134_part_00
MAALERVQRQLDDIIFSLSDDFHMHAKVVSGWQRERNNLAVQARARKESAEMPDQVPLESGSGIMMRAVSSSTANRSRSRSTLSASVKRRKTASPSNGVKPLGNRSPVRAAAVEVVGGAAAEEESRSRRHVSG